MLATYSDTIGIANCLGAEEPAMRLLLNEFGIKRD